MKRGAQEQDELSWPTLQAIVAAWHELDTKLAGVPIASPQLIAFNRLCYLWEGISDGLGQSD